MVDFKIPPLSSPFFRLYAGIFLWFFEDCLIFCDFFNGLAFTWALMGESGERGWILVIDVSSDRPMGSDHTLSQNFSHKEFFKKYSYLVILNRLEETNISICFSINRFFKASSLLLEGFVRFLCPVEWGVVFYQIPQWFRQVGVILDESGAVIG